MGASYGTAKSGVGISSMGVLKPELIFKSIVPIIMAGILGIYGLIVSVILQQKSKLAFLLNRFITKHSFYFHYLTQLAIVNADGYTYDQGYKHLASGLCCGLSSLVRRFPLFLINTFRLPVLLLESLVMQESELTHNKNKSSSVWSLFSFSLRLSDFMVWLLPLFSHNEVISFLNGEYSSR